MISRLGPQQQTLWILCLFCIAAAAEETPCPKGGRIHLESWRCYWLSETPSSWPEAQDSCSERHGGDLASAESPELQSFMHLSFPAANTVWVWLRRGGSDQVVEPAGSGPERRDVEMCSQMALGAPGQWRKARCAALHLFLCEREVTESLPPVDSFLTGLVLMTGIYTHTQIQPLTSVPDIGQATVEMQLFPGMWFSHAGQLVSVELVVQSSPVSSVARVQILRPYCSPSHHLVPPGCSFLLNPFSCCSAVPLCNTTGGCSLGQYWCHLIEACVRTTSPCSPYDTAAGGRFALPPRYITIPPFYHLVADLPLRVNPSSEPKTISVLLPDRAIMVYPDDIVALQHTRTSGTFLHCLSNKASLNLPWRQSYLSLRGTEWGGWWEGGLTSLPPGGQWVDGVVCDLRMLFVDNFHRGTEHDGNFRETTSAPESWVLMTDLTPIQRSKFGLHVIHPVPDEKNQIHIQINVPTIVTVKVLHGQRAKSSWSGPVVQTGVPFLPSCPQEVAQSCRGCKRRSDDEWFSSVTLVLPSVGFKTLNISVVDAETSQSVSVKVWSYEAVTGLSVEPHGCLRILIETPQSFIGRVESGSSVKFTWVIDNLDNFAHEGESYSVVFKKPADYKLKVTASNPVSSQIQEILLTADEAMPLAELEFLSTREVVAVNAMYVYALRVRVDISLPVTFSWDFGDGSGKVIHTQPAPCQTMESLMKKSEKQVDVQHSVNYTYSNSDDYSLYVKVSNQYDSIDVSMKISVHPQLNLLLISSPLPVALVKQTFPLEASVQPSTYTVVYTWDFGDGSEAVKAADHKANHTFTSAGVYNVTVCANNSLSVVTTWLMVDVLEEISGLTVSCNGSTELGTSTDFRATLATGTSLRWSFDFGDGSLQRNLTNSSISHTYKSPGNYRVDVTVSNLAGQAEKSVTVEVYRLAVRGVLPTECVVHGEDVQFTALVDGDVTSLTFHWLFEHGSPLTIVRGKPTTVHRFQSQGTFLISLGVFSSVTSVFFNTSICVEPAIANMTVQSSQEVVAVGEEVCFRVVVFPRQKTGYLMNWISGPSSVISRTENAQQCFIFQDEGIEEVSVTARNRVSNQTASARITIQRPVANLSVAHDGQSETLMVNTLTSFWVTGYVGSNVSVLWDFGDGSSLEEKQNVSHVFTSTGLFAVTATAFNSISRCSVTLHVRVLLPVSDFSLHTSEPYAAVGEETLISATSGTIGTNYYWTVDGMTSSQKGTYQFRFTFPRPGIYQVRVVAQNLVSRKEAAISVEVLERIDGLRIESESWINMKYVATQEKLLFTAAATKGSNIIYHWFAMQSGTRGQIMGDGELFNLLAESPGEISLHLRASNKLGETTSIVSLMAVQRVTGAHIMTESNILASGNAVNISVSVTAGSHLQYLWYVNSDVSLLQTREPFLLHKFTYLGHCVVKVSAWNVLSRSNVSKQFIVQEEVQKVDFEIEGKTHPFYIPTSDAVVLRGFTLKGSDLQWSWEVRAAEKQILNNTNQMFVHSFQCAGTYEVSLNVSNGVNWQMVSHSVIVQDAIKGLMLDMSKSSTCTEEQVTFTPSISNGSNARFVMTFRNKDWIYSQDIIGGQFNTSSLPAGKYLVTVRAWNQVSSAEVSTSLLVKENIQGLRLVNCCSAALEALKGNYFKAEIQSGLPVNFTWSFHLLGFDTTGLMGQEVVFTPPESGLLSVSVAATNGVCSRAVNYTVSVEWPVKKVMLLCDSERVFVGHAVTFSAHVNEGSNLTFLWDFGDSTEVFMTDLHRVSHAYYSPGKYNTQVKVFNRVSHVSTLLNVEVEELQCSSPQASLVPSQSIIFRSRRSFFEASVDNNCTAYKTRYLWEIFKQPDCRNTIVTSPGNKVTVGNHMDEMLPFLQLPKHTLDVGQYCLVFTVSLQGTPLLIQQQTPVTVVHSPLVAVIKGGSHRLWSSLSDLVLDGSDSHDPDVESGGDSALQYEWNLVEKLSFTESQFVNQLIGSNNSRETVLSTVLHPGTVYVFTLTVHKAGRRPASVNQTVTVTDSPVLPVSVECVSCSPLSSPYHATYATPIVLSGHCTQCDEQLQFKWSAEDHMGAALDLNSITSGRASSPNLELRSGVLQPGQSYTFTLNVSQPGRGLWGSAGLTLLPTSPPQGGRCDLSPESEIHLLETVVTYNCTGWEDEASGSSQLIYTLQVAPCQTADPACSPITLYRGTRPSFGSLVPMGSAGPERGTSVITVTLLVEDHLGAKVVALRRTMTVRNPVRDEVTTQWLRNKSQTELWALVQHGNPQQIIPYSIALTSQLNQMESGPGARELRDRREIRENVTRAVASLPVSSLLDVDQISSALSQSTAVPGELLCVNCQRQVLEAVGKMIRVMEEQMSPGVSSAVEAGRNLFSIIGSVLAAVSEPASAPSLGPGYSSSTLALSALTHAGALTRSLMRSHIRDASPLALSSPHLHTVGFQGDPSNLLCSSQSNQSNPLSPLPCQFHIPSSLTSQLKEQRSEVVQVLLGLDADLGSNPLLTAAEPPISTRLVAMELSTPGGEPIPIQDLYPEQAIRVTLPGTYHVGQEEEGGGGRTRGGGNGTCLTVPLPEEGRLNLTVKALDGLNENAGLYISFNFSLDPGATPVSLGHVRVEVSLALPETNASRDPLVREWALALSSATPSMEESVFLTPLLNGTDKPLSVSLTSSLADGGPGHRVSVCVFSSLCQFYSVEERRWSSRGLHPLEGSTLHAAHCLTQHLTVFGASLFVHPGAVVLLPPPGGPMRNMVVAIVCAVLVLIHLLVGLIAHKLDHLDSLRLSQVPLCGRPGLFHYRVLVKTGWRRGAGTTAHVGISLYGVNKSGSRHLQRDGAFQRGGLDQFHLETDDNLGEVWKIRIWHDNTGLDPSWYVQHVVVWDPQSDHMFFFLLDDWLSVENQRNGTVEKEVLASCPEELSQFRRVFSSQLVFGMVERHLWLSLWERPAHSLFTRAQRATCSALVLHLYLALGALWYGAVGTEGQSGPVSDQLLGDVETAAVGMTVAALVFPLQCLLCSLFRKAHSQVAADISVPPSPVCHSVEMDVYLGQSELSGPSFLSLPDSSGPAGDSPSSLLESKAFDSSILDFWSGLAQQTDGACREEGVSAWPSCDSLLNLPLAPSVCELSPALGPIRLLRRKKALMQLRLQSPATPCSPAAPPPRPLEKEASKLAQSQSHNLTSLLTLSDEDLLMSIAAAAESTESETNGSSDSGRDSPRTTSSLSNTHSTGCSSWSEHSEERSLYAAEVHQPDLQSLKAPPFGLHRCPSVASVDSVASTVLPSPSPDSTHSSPTTRIGVARAGPGRLLPPWTLCVIYPVLALLLAACLAVVGLYGSFLSRAAVLQWLLSSLCAFLTSALLLEPLKVCVQSLILTAVWRPVDPEVEDLLAHETSVVRPFGEHSGKVRPPCGFGLLQAKEEARKVRALRSLMRHCVCQLLFLMLVLMVNYQDGVEQTQGRLLQSAVRRQLHRASPGFPELTTLRSWTEAERWITQSLVPQLHLNPRLQLVGRPRLQYTQGARVETVTLGNSSAATQQLLDDLRMASWSQTQYKTLQMDFTHHQRESGLFVCVSVRLECVTTLKTLTQSLSIHPLLIPSSSSRPDLQVVLMALLLISALLILSGELWSMATERAQYLRQCRHWFQLLLASLSLATAVLHLCFLSEASTRLTTLQSHPDDFISFHGVVLLAQRGSQSAAVLLTLLVLKLLGSLRFVRRWLVLGRVLQRAWRELWALTVLLLLLLLLLAHLGHALFSRSVEGFLSVRQSAASALSILKGRMVLQRLCRVHPVLGPLYGLLLMGGVWLVARLCGAVLIRTYRSAQAELFRPTIEPQDYEMVEFFIKRLRLWMGLTKAKEFRHRVKFEGMDMPPSRSSQESRLSTLSSTLPSSHSPSSLASSFSSPRPLSSTLSMRSEDQSNAAEPALDVQPRLDRLLPCLTALLSRFDQVNQVTEDVHSLELKLEEAQARRRKRWKTSQEEKPKEPEVKGKEAGVRHRRLGILHPKVSSSIPSTPSTPNQSTAVASVFSRTRSTHSESDSGSFRWEAAKLGAGTYDMCPPGSPGAARFPRRRAWHSGSSHSADTVQRILSMHGVEHFAFPTARPRSEEGGRKRISDAAPVKRKAWTSEGSETEQD